MPVLLEFRDHQVSRVRLVHLVFLEQMVYRDLSVVLGQQEVLDLPVLWEQLEPLVLWELREPRVPLVLLANKVSLAMLEL